MTQLGNGYLIGLFFYTCYENIDNTLLFGIPLTQSIESLTKYLYVGKAVLFILILETVKHIYLLGHIFWFLRGAALQKSTVNFIQFLMKLCYIHFQF